MKNINKCLTYFGLVNIKIKHPFTSHVLKNPKSLMLLQSIRLDATMTHLCHL